MIKKYLHLIIPFVFAIPIYSLGFLHGSKHLDAETTLKPPHLLFEIWDKVEEKFINTEKIDPAKMWYGAIKGIVRSLGDPHSEFLDPTESAEFLDSLEGTLTGIGAEIGIRNEVLTVISPLRGSPAETAGLLPGDHIFKIDSEFSLDYSLFEAVKKIRGPIGTQVKLTILRAKENKPLEITITRALIDLESVTIDFPETGIAVITVAGFVGDTISELQKALLQLKTQKPTGLVLDLRFNGGGLLTAAIALASDFLATGNVVLIEERNQPLAEISVHGDPLFPEIPLAVLINSGSASAAEIVAGALQDAGRAKIFGETSFGKGSVQEVVEGFSDGSTLRITIAKWKTPAGREIEQLGITPDYPVEMDFAKFVEGEDQQLQAALNWLQNPEQMATALKSEQPKE